MKEFIYLDTQVLHSFIAQIYGGLPSETELGTQDSNSKATTDSDLKEFVVKAKGELANFDLFGIPVSIPVKGGAGAEFKKGKTESVLITEQDTTNEIIRKKLHDDALSALESYLESENLLHTLNTTNDSSFTPKSGDYVKIKTGFQIVDFTLFADVLNDEFFKLMDKLTKKNKGFHKKSMESQVDILRYLLKVLPTPAFIKALNLLAPLKQEFLRQTTRELHFKYGGVVTDPPITLIGRVTRVEDMFSGYLAYDGGSSEFMASIAPLADMVREILKNVDLIKPNDCIVTPIAIFFD